MDQNEKWYFQTSQVIIIQLFSSPGHTVTLPLSVVENALTDLLWKVLQQVLPQTEMSQVGEVANASG